MKTFEEWLQEYFDSKYEGTKDQIEDAYEGWVSNLEPNDVMSLAEAYGEEMYELGSINSVKDRQEMSENND